MPDKIRTKIIHALAIVALLSIPMLTVVNLLTHNGLGTDLGIRKNMVRYGLLLLFFFANYFYFIPKFYFPKKAAVYILVLTLSCIVVLFVPNIIIQESITVAASTPKNPLSSDDLISFSIGSSLVQFFLVLSLSLLIKINSELTAANNDRLVAEMSYLKSQINPHFLFNTLNSLYALTIAKSENAPDVVIKLSNMLRYSVTDSLSERVPLEKEIEYITNYIDVQRLRIAEGSNFVFSLTGNLEKKSIAPLIIIPFIENAIKYGVNEEENWQITTTIDVSEDDLNMTVKHKKVLTNIGKQTTGRHAIETAKQRLNSTYPNAHKLQIEDLPDAFHVYLQINLT